MQVHAKSLRSTTEERGVTSISVTNAVPSWKDRLEQRLRIFRSSFGFTTQWLVGSTVRKSHTTPASDGKPISACLSSIATDASDAGDATALCIGLNSSLHVCTPNSENVVTPLQSLTVGYRLTNLFALPCGLLVELSSGNSTELRRRYYAFQHPDEELVHLAELDDKDRVIFVSCDIPLLVTRNQRYLKVWATVQTSLECHPDSNSTYSKETPKDTSSNQFGMRSALQLRLLHIQTEDIRLASNSCNTVADATAFLVHDLCERLVLCLTSSRTVNVFHIGLSSNGNVESITHAFGIQDVIHAIPILACRRGNSLLDMLVQNRNGTISLFVAQHLVCNVALRPVEGHDGVRCRASDSGRTLSPESLHVFRVRNADNKWLRYEIPRISFASVLVNRCITAITCLFFKSDCLPQMVLLFQSIIMVQQENDFRKGEWESFVDALFKFASRRIENPKEDNILSDWDFLVSSEPSNADRALSSLPYVCSSGGELYNVDNHSNALKSQSISILNLVLEALHLVYENLKLNCLFLKDVRLLASACKSLALHVGNQSYFAFYDRDSCLLKNSADEGNQLIGSKSRLSTVPSFFDHLAAIMRGEQKERFMYLLCNEPSSASPYSSQSPTAQTRIIEDLFICLYSQNNNETELEKAEKVLLGMVKNKIRKVDLDALSCGIAIPIQNALWRCRKAPKPSWEPAAFLLIGREDLISPRPLSKSGSLSGHIHEEQNADLSLLRMQSVSSADYLSIGKIPNSGSQAVDSSSKSNASVNEPVDGCEMTDLIFKLRFAQDRRLNEVRRMLRSTTPLIISPKTETGGANEPDSREFESKLALLLRKRLASPVGRGAFTLRTFLPADPTKPLLIPEICLTGQLFGQKFAKISLSEVSGMLNTEWGEFHNGVASGLRLVAPDSNSDSDNVQVLTRSWIVRHKPSDSPANASHAGMLLALGLGGFLPALRNTDVYQYLVPRHGLTSIGLMIGLAAGNRGTMHEKVSKMLQVHIQAFNGPGFSMPEFSVSVEVQTAAILSIGLLYESSGQPFVLEGLFSELTRCARYGAEVDGREGLSLAAGIAMGMVCLGNGEPLVPISKGKLEDRLACFANGDPISRENSSVTSGQFGSNDQRNGLGVNSGDGDRSGVGDSDACRVHELSTYDIDVVAPGALLGLGLMYLKTNNQVAASRIRTPKNFYDLDRTRPDLVYLQVLAKSLILWDTIESTFEWVASALPSIIVSRNLRSSVDFGLLERFSDHDGGGFLDVDDQGILSARAFGISAACTAIALRFAGALNPKAVKLISQACIDFERALLAVRKDCEDEEWLHATCLTSCSLALGIVCAGSGDLSVFRLLRRLRKRTGPSLQDKRYGRYMGMDMAIGFLFLGGGCQTFGTSKASIASLICATYPRFPEDVTDNQYHLQAFRHLYVLAVEPRCIETRDIDTDLPCQVDVEVHTEDGSVLTRKAPCIVPESSCAKRISVVSERYWPTTLSLDPGSSEFGWFSTARRKIVYVKRRPGHLSYLADPKGSKGILARSLRRPSSDIFNLKSCDVELFIQEFSADPEILAFARLFCQDEIRVGGTSARRSLRQPSNAPLRFSSDSKGIAPRYSQILFECLASDRAEALRYYFDAERAVAAMKRGEADPSMIGSLLLCVVYLRGGRTQGSSALISDDDLSFIVWQPSYEFGLVR